MGWAKYLEDIVSRHNGTSMAQAQLQREIDRRHPRDAAKMTINQLAQRKQKMTREILQNPGQPTLRGARLIETMCPHEAS